MVRKLSQPAEGAGAAFARAAGGKPVWGAAKGLVTGAAGVPDAEAVEQQVIGWGRRPLYQLHLAGAAKSVADSGRGNRESASRAGAPLPQLGVHGHPWEHHDKGQRLRAGCLRALGLAIALQRWSLHPRAARAEL